MLHLQSKSVCMFMYSVLYCSLSTSSPLAIFIYYCRRWWCTETIPSGGAWVMCSSAATSLCRPTQFYHMILPTKLPTISNQFTSKSHFSYMISVLLTSFLKSGGVAPRHAPGCRIIIAYTVATYCSNLSNFLPLSLSTVEPF
jgi:hypothetical protein